MESNESNEDKVLDTSSTVETVEVSSQSSVTQSEKDEDKIDSDEKFCEKLLVLQKTLKEISDKKKEDQTPSVTDDIEKEKVSISEGEPMEVETENTKVNDELKETCEDSQKPETPPEDDSTQEEVKIKKLDDTSVRRLEEVTEAIELSLDSSSESAEEKTVGDLTEKKSVEKFEEKPLQESISESAEKTPEKSIEKPLETSLVGNGERRESKRKRSLNISPSSRTSPVEQNGSSSVTSSPSKRKKLEEKPSEILEDDGKSDRFCWRCHKEGIESRCSTCPRSWHRRCMGGAPPLTTTTTDWVCSECAGVQQAENPESRSPAMAQVTPDQLCMMLRYVVERMREQTGSAPFLKAVDINEVPNYLDFIRKPMDLSLLDSNVKAKMYNSTDAFMADAKWIQHNCIIFNTYSSKLTNTAKQMLKVARQEVSEIEACPDCFALGRNLPRPLSNWFIQPCWKPHPIVWAKLKGFPFWPAKALSRVNTQGLIDVRFFGEHDRAWVSPKDIYLYSEEPPAPLPKKKKPEMDDCMKEVEEHSKRLKEVFGQFRYAPPKVQYDPHDLMQIQILLPQYDPVANKRIAGSKEIKTIPLSITVEKSPTKVERRPKTPLPERRPKTPLPEKQSKTPVSEKRPKTPLPEKRPKTPVPEKRPKTPLPEKRPKTPSPKNQVVANANGVTETPVELRKSLRRKQMEESPLRAPVNKSIPETSPVVVVLPKQVTKNNSKTLSSNSPDVNKTATGANKKEPVKNNATPQNKNSEVKSNSGIKKVIVKNLKNDNLKKLKLVKSLINKDEITVTTKSNSLKNGNDSLPSVNALNSLKNNPEILKSLKLSHKSKTILIQQPNSKKTVNAIIVSPKINSKTHQVENKIIQVINKSQNDAKKTPVNNVQKNNKNETSMKPMISIPISTNKDQMKAIFQTMNSNTSESARHFNDKEMKLNTSLPVIKQEPKDDFQPKLTITRKPSKARKSLPNKPVNFPSPIVSMASNTLNKSTSKQNTMISIPAQNSVLRTAHASYHLPPPEAGPNTAFIHKNSKDLATKVAKLIAETIKEAAENNDGTGTINQYDAKIHFLKLKIEKMNWEHQQEISELKHNNELVIRELKASMEVERYRALQEAEIDKRRCVEETKRKQWCVACGREAKFYCCWNTAYCDYPCQQKHWSTHFSTCNQKAAAANNSTIANTSNTSVSSPTPTMPATTTPVTQSKGTQKMPKLVIYKPKSSVKKA